MTRMITRKENHRKDARLAADRRHVDRERAEALLPLVRVLLDQAEQEIREREEREEGQKKDPSPAQRSGRARP